MGLSTAKLRPLSDMCRGGTLGSAGLLLLLPPLLLLLLLLLQLDEFDDAAVAGRLDAGKLTKAT